MSDAYDMESTPTFEELRRKGEVVDYDTVRRILLRTEPLEAIILETDGSSEVKVRFDEEWNQDIKEQDDSNLVPVWLEAKEGGPFQLTKRAVVTLLNRMGLADRYSFKCPGSLLEPQVNFWFENVGIGKDPWVKMLVKDSYAVSFMDYDAPVVSNLDVLDTITTALRNQHNIKDVWFLPDMLNNFVTTSFSIMFPKKSFKVTTTRDGKEVTDNWHFGLKVTNSLTAQFTKRLSLVGFMLEENSLGGILPEYSRPASFLKNASIDVEDVRGWVRSTLDQILATLPAEAEIIQNMPTHMLTGKVGTMTADLFTSMKIPKRAQEICLDLLTEYGDMSAYGLMFALAGAVGPREMHNFDAKNISHVQEVAGALMVRAEEVCNSCGRMHIQ